jgi:SAM-dependent methyltransferase
MTARYTIEGGQAGADRLDVLARVHGPGTLALLDQVGVPAGARCLDVGCGGGHVSRELARRVGTGGSVVGIDMDEVVVGRARAETDAAITNVEFRTGDAADLEQDAYDLAYARFLLSHVGEPGRVVAAMVAAVRPGGLLVLEDTDFTGCFCVPPCSAYERFAELYRETLQRRGGNADRGRELPALLHAAGIAGIEVSTAQPCGLDGDVKRMFPLTLARVADSVVAEGVTTSDEIDALARELEHYCGDPTTMTATPRVVQSWGRRPAAAA